MRSRRRDFETKQKLGVTFNSDKLGGIKHCIGTILEFFWENADNSKFFN